MRATLPVLVALKNPGFEEESDITLGIEGVFDIFDVAFSKSKNRITLKKAKPKS